MHSFWCKARAKARSILLLTGYQQAPLEASYGKCVGGKHSRHLNNTGIWEERHIKQTRTAQRIITGETLAFFLRIFFLHGSFFKSLLNLIQYHFCFMFWFFGHKVCGILDPQIGIEPSYLVLEGEVLATGPLGKFGEVYAFHFYLFHSYFCSYKVLNTENYF